MNGGKKKSVSRRELFRSAIGTGVVCALGARASGQTRASGRTRVPRMKITRADTIMTGRDLKRLKSPSSSMKASNRLFWQLDGY